MTFLYHHQLCWLGKQEKGQSLSQQPASTLPHRPADPERDSVEMELALLFSWPDLCVCCGGVGLGGGHTGALRKVWPQRPRKKASGRCPQAVGVGGAGVVVGAGSYLTTT